MSKPLTVLANPNSETPPAESLSSFAAVKQTLGSHKPSRLTLTLEGGKQKLLTTGGVIVEDGEIDYDQQTGKWFVKLEVQMPEDEV